METSNTEANLKYFRKTTSFKTDGNTEVVKHFLTKNITGSTKFSFFVQKIKEDGFSLTIRFENGKGDAAVVISFDSDKLSFHIEGNNSSSANQSLDAVWADLREYRLILRLTNDECWIFWDVKLMRVFHSFPVTTVESVVVATGPGAFYRSQAYDPRIN